MFKHMWGSLIIADDREHAVGEGVLVGATHP